VSPTKTAEPIKMPFGIWTYALLNDASDEMPHTLIDIRIHAVPQIIIAFN